jgi:hypothetical protein
MASLKEYFHLKRDTFSIMPRRDATVFFGRQPLQQRILHRVQSDFLDQRNVPKFFLYGRYGAGKTHSLAHIEYELRNDAELLADYPQTEPRLTELPPLRSKDSWATLHGHLVDELGRDMVQQAAHKVIATSLGASTDLAEEVERVLSEKEVLRYGDTALKASQAQVFRNLLFGGTEATRSWEWLKGRGLSVDEASKLNTQTNLSGTPNLIAALLNIASLIWVGLERKIVFLIDEGEAVRSVTNNDSVEEFKWAIRQLVDDANDVLGLVVAFQTEGGMEDTPPIFDDDAIQRRVGYEAGYIDLTELLVEADDVRDFIRRVLDHLVDQDAARQTIEAESLETEPEAFPLTPEAIDRIAEHVIEEDKKIPSQIIGLLAEGVKRAYLEGKGQPGHLLVEGELLEQALFPAEAE